MEWCLQASESAKKRSTAKHALNWIHEIYLNTK